MYNPGNLTYPEAIPSGTSIRLDKPRIATVKTARDINRRMVLNLIRKHQPVSRADLVRRSRLQRSTVSAIIEQLIAERWVTTGACKDLSRGRKPTFLYLNGNRAGVIGIDIRPKETTITLANLEMRFLTQGSMFTNPDPALLIKQLGGRLQHLAEAYPQITIEGIGVVVAGRVERPSNRLMCDAHLGWGPVDFKKLLGEATGLTVELENVANACALAEFWMGDHRDNVRNLVAVTVSEDIGIGMIFNGQLVRGAMGLAGEFGHIMIQKDGPLCRCGNHGCFEACASNSTAVRHFGELAFNQSGETSVREVDFDSILNLAELDDRDAGEALNRMARSLGEGLAMIITSLAPDVLMVVGELTRAWGRMGPLIDEEVRRRLRTKSPTLILPSAYGAHARLRGAIALVLQKHFGTLSPL